MDLEQVSALFSRQCIKMQINHFIRSFLSNATLYDSDDRLVSANQVNQEFKLIREYLLSNLSSNSIAAILLNKDYKYILTLLACMDAGITYIPLKVDCPEKRIQLIKETAAFDLLIDDELTNHILNQNKTSSTNESFEITEGKPLYIIFTSGSTGEPKGVTIQRRSFCNFVNWVDKYFSEITSNDRILNTADFSFDLSMLDIALLLTKNPHFHTSKFNNNIFTLASEIELLNITTMATVPNTFALLLTDGIYSRSDLSNLKHLLLGGARFSYGLYNKAQEYLSHTNIYNLYGPTEATVYCTAKRIAFKNEVIDKVVSAGRDISNCHTVIMSNSLQEQPAKTKGEVYISGIQLMQAYHNDKHKTQEVLVTVNGKQYYKTGDIGFKDQADNLYITGRLNDTIKISGYRVNLSDIDSYILSVSYISECATIAIHDEIKENVLIAYIKTSEKDKSTIYEELENMLPSYQIPQDIILIDQFPINSSGKISKNSLVDLYKSNQTEARKLG